MRPNLTPFLKHLLLSALLLLTCFQTNATHIAGGEIQMRHVVSDQYEINLVIFFDEVNGNPGAKDQDVMVRIFRNADNIVMNDVTLRLVRETPVFQSAQGCASPLMIRRLDYAATISLSAQYNHPGGYYIVWERCCRTYSLTNIYSEDPNYATRYAGQTFYLEFPAVTRQGTAFINSSPLFNDITRDFGCVGQPYYIDFGATDADGDSLVYSLVAPLSTQTGDALPLFGPRPRPYPEVMWRPGFGVNSMTKGNPDLHISKRGVLRVTPNIQGAFIYSVVCKEYRQRQKIGEVRRDFVLMVSNCAPQKAPTIQVRSGDGTYSDGDLNVHVTSNQNDESRCIKLRIDDEDVFANGSATEKIWFKAVPLDFDANLDNILPDVTTATLDQTNSFAEFTVCAPRCSPAGVNQFTIGFVAYSDECGAPLTDTVRVVLHMDPVPGCDRQTIDFPFLQDHDTNDSPFNVVATASSGLPVTFTSDNSFATVAGALVTLQQPGIASITATQSGDDTWLAAPTVTRRFCIRPAAPVITKSIADNMFLLTSSSGEATHWFIDGTFVGSGAGTYTTLTPGNYTAKNFVAGCLSATSNTIVIGEEVLAVENVFRRDLYQVYPNPVENNLLTIHAPVATRMELRHTDGRVVMDTDLPARMASIDITSLPPGLYFARLCSKDGCVVVKVVKTNR